MNDGRMFGMNECCKVVLQLVEGVVRKLYCKILAHDDPETVVLLHRYASLHLSVVCDSVEVIRVVLFETSQDGLVDHVWSLAQNLFWVSGFI